MIVLVPSSDLDSQLHNKTVVSFYFVNLFFKDLILLDFCFGLFEGISFTFHDAEKFFCPEACAVENCTHDQNINMAPNLSLYTYT